MTAKGPLSIGVVIGNARLWEETQALLRQMPVRVMFESAQTSTEDVLFARIDRFKPDAVLLDPAAVPLPLAELIPLLKALPAAPLVVIVQEAATADEIIRAMRAGADEFVLPPIETSMKEALERLAQRASVVAPRTAGPQGKAFGFLSAKAGCGATTVACHAAVELARVSGKTTLLGDFDLPAGTVRVLMKANSRYSVLDAARNTADLDESYWRALVSNGFPGVEVLAGPGPELFREYPNPEDVRQVLEFARGRYAYVVADLGAGLDAASLRTLEEVEELVLVTTPEMPALQMAKLQLHRLGVAGFRRSHIRLVLNRVSRRVELAPAEIERALDMEIYATLPNDYGALDRAYTEGRLLPENNHLRQAIGRMIHGLAGLDAPGEGKRRFSLFHF
ncbi:MAG: AAA family ATPase [Bryobacteraceae bacterium]